MIYVCDGSSREIGITVTHTHTNKASVLSRHCNTVRLTHEDLSRGLEFETQ